MGQISYGTITITDTNDIESIVVEYARNQSSTTAPTSGWSTTRPTWQQGYYIWQRTRTHKTGTATTADIIGTAVCITGSTGSSGAAGRGLTGTTTTYCNYGSGTPADNYASWSTTIPAYDSTKPNYWVKVVNTYSAAPTTETIKYKDQGITDAMATAAEANEIAASAEEKAAQAESVAVNVAEDAQGALSIARATEQHFWFNPTTSGTLEAGAYITDTAIDTFKSGKTGGYLLARSDGLELGKASNKFMTLSASALNFYRPGTTTIDASLTSSGLVLTKGGIRFGTAGQSGFIYLSTDGYGSSLTINSQAATDWKQVIGTKFGVRADGTVYASGVSIAGTISATGGTIGGFKIDSTSIRTNDVAITSNADNSIGLSSADFTRTINGTSRAGLRFAIGDKFGVTGDGALYASGANISGVLTVQSGSNVYTKTESDNKYEVAGEVAKYITYISAEEGIKVHNTNDSSNYLQLNSTAVSMFKGGTEKIRLEAENLRLGDSTNYANVNADGLKVYKGSLVASFGSTSQVGPNNDYHIIIDGNGFAFLPADGTIGGGEISSYSEGLKFNVSGTGRSLPSCNGYFYLTNRSFNVFIADNPGSSISRGILDIAVGSSTSSIDLGLSHNSTIGSAGAIKITDYRTRLSYAYNRTEIEIGRITGSSTGCQIYLRTDVNIPGIQNSHSSADGSGIFGQAYLYFGLQKTGKSTSSLGNVGCFQDTNRSNKGLSSYYFATISSGSSRRYKHGIGSLEDESINAHKLYNAEVIQFFYNSDYINKEDSRYGIPLPGFIAEDLYEIYPIAVDLNQEGKPETWNEHYIIPPMLKLIQEQHQEIKELKVEIMKLKRRFE